MGPVNPANKVHALTHLLDSLKIYVTSKTGMAGQEKLYLTLCQILTTGLDTILAEFVD